MDSSYTYLMFLQTAIFVIAWVSVKHHVAKNGPIRQARTVTKINSWVYAAAAFGLMVITLLPSYDAVGRQLYHYSKFYEYIDILAVLASGGAIDLHFGFHHLTTPYFTFFRVLQHSDGWQVFGAANAFHHMLMYAYFGGASFLRPLLDTTGSIQLLAGITTDLWIAYRKMGSGGEPIWPNLFGAGLLTAYLVLWFRDLRIRAMAKDLEKAN